MNKDFYRRTIRNVLNEWEGQIESLKSNTDLAEKDAQKKMIFRERVEDMETRKKLAEDKISELENASEEGWEYLKPEIDNALAELKVSVDKTIERLM